MSGRTIGKAPLRYTIAPETAPPVGLVSRRVSEMTRRESDIDVTEGLRTFVIDDEDEPSPTPQQSSPAIVITPPPEPLVNRQRLRPRQQSAQDCPTPRPKLVRKAATAPAGALHLYRGMKPQPPRRAISARTGQSQGSRHRRSPMTSPPLPRPSLFGTPASRSLISRRKTVTKSGGKTGLKPKKNVWRLSSPPSQRKAQAIAEVLNERKTSFSEKARVQKTLRHKKLDKLKTNIVDFKLKDLPGTPGSMIATPREMYGKRSTSPSASYSGKRRSLLPVSPTKARHFSLPLSSDVQHRDTFKGTNSATKPGSKKRRTVYIPGPIRLEERSAATPRRGSIASMEPFDTVVEPRAKRFSDMVALDGIAMFFQSLGVVEQSTDEGFDKFWLANNRGGGRPASPRKIAPPVPPRPHLPALSSFGSGLFPSQKALRQEEKPRPPSPGTPGRQKRRLRQLLKPGRSFMS